MQLNAEMQKEKHAGGSLLTTWTSRCKKNPLANKTNKKTLLTSCSSSVDLHEGLFTTCALTGNVGGSFSAAAAYCDMCSSEQVFPCRGSRKNNNAASPALVAPLSRTTNVSFCFVFFAPFFFCFGTSFRTFKHTRGEELNPDASCVRSAHTGGALFSKRAAQINYVNRSSARVMRSRSLFTRLAALTLLFSFYHSKLSRATALKCFLNFVYNEYLMFQ